MRCRVGQRTLVVLAVDLDQRAAELLEHLNADWLVVDECARAPIGQLHTAEDQFVFRRNVIGRQQRARRMTVRNIEDGRHLPLLKSLPHQRLVAAAAQGQRESVEKDRFSSAGLAGERGQAAGKIDIKPLDQNNVANGQSGEHRNRPCRFAIIKDAEGRHKACPRAGPYTVNPVCRDANLRCP